MKTGLFIGRFQPFHLGHLSAIRQALRQVDFLVIGIGSSQTSRTADNPFTAAERREMIEGSLRDEKIPESSYRIVEIPDIHDDARWPAHVRKLAGNFDVLFTGSKDTRKLFEKYAPVTIQAVKFEIGVSATEIRKKLTGKGQDFEKMVPPATLRVLTNSWSQLDIKLI